jgi:hypothetical protein
MPSTPSEPNPLPFSVKEQSALRYVAGYVVRKIHEKYKSESARDEAMFLLSLNEKTVQAHESWIDTVDRGGLSDETYCLFCAMEEVCCHLTGVPLQCTYARTHARTHAHSMKQRS